MTVECQIRENGRLRLVRGRGALGVWGVGRLDSVVQVLQDDHGLDPVASLGTFLQFDLAGTRCSRTVTLPAKEERAFRRTID